MRQFDIAYADLNPPKGHAQSGKRPCVVVQCDVFNRYAPTVVIVPLTSVIRVPFPSEFVITPSTTNGLSKTSRFLGSQIMTIDRRFLSDPIGSLENEYRSMAKTAMATVLGW